MAIGKIIKAALKAISYSNIELTKNYKLLRIFEETVHKKVTILGVSSIDKKIENVPVRIYTPSKIKNEKILVFFHGGGWISGSIDSYDSTCSNMSKITGCKVVSVEYGLAPENKFPHALEECYSVVREVVTFCAIFSKDKSQIVLIGDSAGANLAASLSLLARDRGEFNIENQILIYPVTGNDYSENSRFDSVKEYGEEYILTAKHLQEYVELYIKDENDLKNSYMAPILCEKLNNQPRTLIITCEFDPLRDEGEEYGIKLRNAGNYVEIYRIPDGIHGFFMLSPRVEQVKKTYEYINNFLN